MLHLRMKELEQLLELLQFQFQQHGLSELVALVQQLERVDDAIEDATTVGATAFFSFSFNN